MTLMQVWDYIRGLTFGQVISGVAGALVSYKTIQDAIVKKNPLFSWIKRVYKKFGRVLNSGQELSEIRATMEELAITARIDKLLDPIPKFELDIEGNLHSPNRALLEKFNVTEDNITGRRWEKYVFDEDILNVSNRLHRSMKNKSDFLSEHIIRTGKTGQLKCKILGIPLINTEGKLLGFVGQIEIV